MNATERLLTMLQAGFSWEEIEREAASEYKGLLDAGFPIEEVNKEIHDKYRFHFSYDPDLEDGAIQLNDALMDKEMEEMEQELVDAEVDFYKAAEEQAQEQSRIAAEQSKGKQRQLLPFEEEYTPEQQEQIAKERENLPMFRRYSDTELRSQSLADLWDSSIVDASERGPLTWRDRRKQKEYIKEGILQPEPTPDVPPPYIRSTTPDELARQKRMAPYKVATTKGDFASLGFSHGVGPLLFSAPRKDLLVPDNMPLSGQVIMSMSQALGDLPTTIALGSMGAAAAGATGPGMIPAAFATAAAGNEALRTTLLNYYEKGYVSSASDFWDRIMQVGQASTLAGLSGYMAGTAGVAAHAGAQQLMPQATGRAATLLRGAAQPTAEVATMTGTQAAIEGRLPTAEDLIVGGAMVGGFRAAGFYTPKLAYMYKKHSMTPESLIQYTKHNRAAREDIASVNRPQPDEMGGVFEPLYLIRRNEHLPNHKPGEQWYHVVKNVAAKSVENINKSNKVTDPDAPHAYRVEAAAIPADANMLYIMSRTDPNRARIYKQFVKSHDPEAKLPTGKDLTKRVDDMFSNPSEAFIDFLKSGKAKIGPQEDVPVENIIGMRVGNRVRIFDPESVTDGSVFSTDATPMDLAARDIHKSISVGESQKTPAKQKVLDTYSSTIDALQALNTPARAGWVTVPYLMSRIFKGVDGIFKHWLEYGRTAFTRVSTIEPTGMHRAITGKSLNSIFDAAASKAKFKLDPETSLAVEKFGAKLNKTNVRNNERVMKALDQAKDNGDINMASYEKAKLQLMESTQILENRKDPHGMFRVYLVAKHAKELADQGIETGLDPSAIHSIVNNKAMQARFDPAAKELYSYMHALLEYRYQAGLISPKSYNTMRLKYPDYIPFQRVLDESGASITTGTYGQKGSKRAIIDPLESIVRQTQHTIREAERNEVMRVIARDFGKVITPGGKKTARVGTMADFRALDAYTRGAGSEKTISYKVAGKEIKAQVPTEIYNVAQLLDPQSLSMFNGLLRFAANLASVLRAGAILDPEFGGRNVFRDQNSAHVNSSSGYRPFVDFMRGLSVVLGTSKHGKKIFPNAEKTYYEWLRHGGSQANLISMDRKYTQDICNTILKTSNVQNSIPLNLRAIDQLKVMINPYNWFKGGLKTLQNLSELSEEGTRLGEYMRARERGINPMEAAYRSREVSMDFARIGASMKALNAMTVFLNAKIQGGDRLIRQIRAHPERTTANIIAGVVLPSIWLSMVQQDIIHNSPDSPMAQALQEVPDWQKNMYWLVPTPLALFRIPLAHEYGIPFANPVRLFVEHMYNEDPDKNFLSEMYESDYLGDAGEQFFLNWSAIINSIVPSAALGLVEVLSNTNTFTRQPIIPPHMERQLPETRANRQTTEMAKSISRQLSKIDPLHDSRMAQRVISPVAIDHLITSYTGTLGKRLWQSLDLVAQKAGIVDKVRRRPAKTLEDIPLIKAFMVKFPEAGASSINDFFEKAEKYEQALASAKVLMQEGTPSSRERAELMLLERDFVRLTSIRGNISDLRRAINIIHFSEELHPEDKRHQIETMYLHMIQMSKEGLNILDTISRTNKELRKQRKEQGDVD